ncbi:calcium-binding protein [Streptosporangium sp. G11]
MSKTELEALAEEATVDAYDEHEQLSDFHVMLEERLAMPFQTTCRVSR